MAHTVISNILESATVEDSAGIPISATAKYIVQLDEATAPGGRANLATVMAANGMPNTGDAFDTWSPSLLCRTRSAVMIGVTTARVTAEYRHVNRTLNNSHVWRHATRLKTITTDKMPDGKDIVVSYGGLSQTAEVTAMEIDWGFRTEVLVTTSNVSIIAKDWAGHVNSSPWLGGDAGTWMCAAADIKPMNILLSPQKWIIDFEFRSDPRTWYPRAAWRASDTGRTPIGLAEYESPSDQEGRKLLRAFIPSRDFTLEPS